MNFFDRLSNGWQIAKLSFNVLKANSKLIVFPILSGISLLLIVATFAVSIFAAMGWDVDNFEFNRGTSYIFLFIFYVINYFVVVFFNMALIHCAKLYFAGEEVTVKKGLSFSMSRIGVIFSWAVFAGIVGTVLKIIQENTGSIGKFVTGLIGIVWNIATFFVVPIIAYEQVGPLDAFKRSTEMMKEKWGESLGANFSFGLIQFVAIILVFIPAGLIGYFIHPLAGVIIAVPLIFLIITITNAAQTIFISAVYNNIKGDLSMHFDQQLIDGLFESKKK